MQRKCLEITVFGKLETCLQLPLPGLRPSRLHSSLFTLKRTLLPVVSLLTSGTLAISFMWFVIEWPFEDFTKHDLFLSNIQGSVKWSCQGDSVCLLIITNMFPHTLGNANHLLVPWMAALSCLLVWEPGSLSKGLLWPGNPYPSSESPREKGMLILL